MAKTASQLQCFLAEHSYKSQEDIDYISAICSKIANEKLGIYPEYDPEDGVDAEGFMQWVKKGFGCGDVVEYDGSLAICGICHLGSVVIVGRLSDNQILTCNIETPSESLKIAPEASKELFMHKLREQDLQFNEFQYKLEARHIPEPGERVIYRGNGTKGLGVVRFVNTATGEVTMYCYYDYGTKKCGYSMNETDVCNLNDYVFESVNDSSSYMPRTASMNTQYCRRRLKTELAKYGKAWNGKQKRIEPVDAISPIGQPYWYINDKVRILKEYEKGKATSKMRYKAGNYFRTYEDALYAAGQIGLLLQNVMAGERRGEIPEDV